VSTAAARQEARQLLKRSGRPTSRFARAPRLQQPHFHACEGHHRQVEPGPNSAHHSRSSLRRRVVRLHWFAETLSPYLLLAFLSATAIRDARTPLRPSLSARLSRMYSVFLDISAKRREHAKGFVSTDYKSA
jgi:hypothetical protein